MSQLTTPTNANQGEQTTMPDQTLNAAADRRAQERAASDAEQQTKFNAGQPHTPDPRDAGDGDNTGPALAKFAMADFLDWQGNVLSRLGLLALTGDVRADNPTLTAALARIAAAGAPTPVIKREVVAWPGGAIAPGGAFTVDVYVFTHPREPKNTVTSTEFLLAANPAITIGELVKARIIADPNA